MKIRMSGILSVKATFEQRPEGDEGVSRVDVAGKSHCIRGGADAGAGLTVVNPILSAVYQAPFKCFTYIISLLT